jgi:hypothetical protein
MSYRTLIVAGLCVAASVGACGSGVSTVPADHRIPLGTRGGDLGGLIVEATSMHLHVGCTYGDVPGRVVVDDDGKFDVAGDYMLRAYPIAVGPTVPARFTGRLVGTTLTITATVDDTITHQTVIRGPVTLTLGVQPKLANCPICRTPGERARARRMARGSFVIQR